MSDQYLGQIEFFAFGFAPKGWAFCAGQTMSIAQSQALFSLLGTTYGGNGINTFQLPDLRGRVPVSQGNFQGNAWVIGQIQGEENHTLLITETPQHTHMLAVVAGQTVANTSDTPSGSVVLAQATGEIKGAQSPGNLFVADNAPNQPMAAAEVGAVGGQPHNNMMPFLVLNPCIALVGIFPSRS
jgi:microcystin-dependent protein